MAIFSANKKSLSCCILCFAKVKIEVLSEKKDNVFSLFLDYRKDQVLSDQTMLAMHQYPVICYLTIPKWTNSDKQKAIVWM
ncbi:MAG: hypothetical protein U0J62_11570 [Lachnospiraceae bacterium]|nr:hypothetical protein [Jutongia hominis]MEE0290855.1 hypothetical protein [Lachnospiraceae bacterium]